LRDNFSGLSEKVDDNNAMWAYGAGAALNLGHFSLRAEYEDTTLITSTICTS
jgi:hypothetical protein